MRSYGVRRGSDETATLTRRQAWEIHLGRAREPVHVDEADVPLASVDVGHLHLPASAMPAAPRSKGRPLAATVPCGPRLLRRRFARVDVTDVRIGAADACAAVVDQNQHDLSL